MINLCKGTKGRLKASGLEFEIMEVTSTTSTIRYKGERKTHEIKDSELRELADNIEKWGTDDS